MKAWAEVLYLTVLSGLATTVFSETYIQSLDGIGDKMEQHGVFSFKNICDRLEELKNNADGVDIFLTALEQVVVDGGESVRIPSEIDPEQHNISLNDAFERTKDFLMEQNEEAKNLLSKVYRLINYSADGDTSSLKKIRDDILEILDNFKEAEQDIIDYRRVTSTDQMYDYYYDDDNAEEFGDEENEEEDEKEARDTGFEDFVKDTEAKDDESVSDDDSDDTDEENLVLSLENYFLDNRDDGQDVDGDGDDEDDLEVAGFNENGGIAAEIDSKQHNTTARESTNKIATTTVLYPVLEEVSTSAYQKEGFVEDEVLYEREHSELNVTTRTNEFVARPKSSGIENSGPIHEEKQFNAIFVEENSVISEKGNESVSVEQSDIGVEETDAIVEYSKDNLDKGAKESMDDDSVIVEQYQAVFVEEKEEEKIKERTRPSYGNDAIDLSEFVTVADLYDTKLDWEEYQSESNIVKIKDSVTEMEWYEPVWDTDGVKKPDTSVLRGRFPTAVYVSIATPLAILLISMIACAVCGRRHGYRRSVTIRSRPLSESHKDARVSVISICDSDIKKTYPPTVASLPSYLEVISEKVETVPKCHDQRPFEKHQN